ncbi:MAG: hypothetical protein ACU826_09710 [Gammaproteobacteria bacterium]
MKKRILTLFFLGLSIFASLVYADIALKTSEEVEGAWKLENTQESKAASEIIKREDTWTFKGGKVTISHIPREGSYYDQSPVDYKIEDGKLKISILGRTGRYETFSLVEKDENNMILKSTYGTIYRFKKK